MRLLPSTRRLRCAVLKLDTEGDGAASRVEFLKLSTGEEWRRFFYLEGGDAKPWTTDQVVHAIGSR